MLRSRPKFTYCGLTIILSNPSRFDKLRLLSSTGGNLFEQFMLQPDYNSMQCDVREMNDDSPLIEGTRCILLLGQESMHKYLQQTRLNILNEMRGSVLLYKDIPCIPTYLPQDAADFKNYESEFNTQAGDYTEGDEDADVEETGDVKAMSVTKRANFAFWLFHDVRKAKEILLRGYTRRSRPSINLLPSDRCVIDMLQSEKGRYFYFDVETDYEDQNILCFSYSFNGLDIYSVPILDYNYKWAYTSIPNIMRALAVAVRDNITVAHNGHAFDFFVLAKKYGVPIGKRTYDTMMAMHRCYPGVEKSLGHCISLWTWENFHKDTDSEQYRTHTDMVNKLEYCGRDVYGMYLVHKAIEQYASKVPGLEESINIAMRSIRPYLTSTMQGMRYDPERVKAICGENDRLMMQYERVCKILVGPTGLEEVRKAVKGKPGLFCGSTKQQVKYFHDMLGYPVIHKSEKTGEPSLGKKSLFKLQLKHDNPVIALINLYRTVQKETGALSFNAWKDDNNKTLPRIKDICH